MARDTMDVCLRFLRDTNKSKFDSYSVRNVPCFETVFQLKQHFLENCQAEILQQPTRHFKLATTPKETRNSLYRPKSSWPKRFPWLKTGR